MRGFIQKVTRIAKPWMSRSFISGAPEFDTKRRKLLISIELVFKLPLQKGQLSIFRGLSDVQGLKHLGLLGTDGRDAADGFRLVDSDLMALNGKRVMNHRLVVSWS